jgi:hypothetical protein
MKSVLYKQTLQKAFNPDRQSMLLSYQVEHLSITLRITGFFRLCPLSGILNKLENMFRKLDLFPFSGEGETSTLFGPLERLNLNHWTTYVSITTHK